MTMLTLFTLLETVQVFGAMLLVVIGSVCLGLMLMLALMTMISVRHRSRVGAMPMDDHDGTITLGGFLCSVTFTAALLFFVLAARLILGF
jgi:hypothetical protein